MITDYFIIIGILLGAIFTWAMIFTILALDTFKKLRKYRYRYGYDNEIENPSKTFDIANSENFSDWTRRVGFERKNVQ